MIIQKPQPQFDPEVLELGEVILIFGVDDLMMDLFASRVVMAIITSVHPFQIDIVYVDDDDSIKKGMIKIENLTDDKLVIQRFMEDGK